MGGITVQNRSAVRRFFRPDGLLSTKHPAFEPRRGQLDMALEVEEALLEKRKLIVEAGTGTGKTLAYLVPALLSGRRVVISTDTKALQEQLFFRDIPFLEKVFGRPLRVCYMKGRSNYACRQKIYDAEDTPALSRPGGGGGLSDHSGMGEDDGNRRPRRRFELCRRTALPGGRSTRARSSAPDRSASNTSAALLR